MMTKQDCEAADRLACDIHHDSRSDENPVGWDEACGWIELGCWTALAMVPFLYWINGPAVSQDQLIVRWLVVIVPLGGAVVLRLRAMKRSAAYPSPGVETPG